MYLTQSTTCFGVHLMVIQCGILKLIQTNIVHVVVAVSSNQNVVNPPMAKVPPFFTIPPLKLAAPTDVSLLTLANVKF